MKKVLIFIIWYLVSVHISFFYITKYIPFLLGDSSFSLESKWIAYGLCSVASIFGCAILSDIYDFWKDKK